MNRKQVEQNSARNIEQNEKHGLSEQLHTN